MYRSREIVRLRYPFSPVELLAYLTLSRGHDDGNDVDDDDGDDDDGKRARNGPRHISRAFAKYVKWENEHPNRYVPIRIRFGFSVNSH